MNTSRILNFFTASLTVGLLTLGSAQAATFRWDGGAGTGDWATDNNWNPNGTKPPTGIVTSNRIDIDSPTQESVYTAAQGNTTFGSGTTVRGLVIGSGNSGTLRITGGIITTVGSGNATDLLGNIDLTDTGTLIIDGGGYIAKHLTLNNNNAHGILTLNVGTATIETLTLNLQDSGDSIVNLNGGTLNVKTLTARTTGTATMNFNGGTLQAGGTFSAPTAGITYVVKSDGAKIDTNNFDLTIGALTDGTGGGGLTKSGAGTLTLNAANTYTGTTTVSAGTLLLDTIGSIDSTTLGFGVTDSNNGQLTANNAAFSFNGALDLDLAGVTVGNQMWTLFDGTGFDASALTISGVTSNIGSLTFGDIGAGDWQGTDGSGRTWTLSSDLGTLIVIPEPSSLSLMVLCGLAMLLLRRKML